MPKKTFTPEQIVAKLRLPAPQAIELDQPTIEGPHIMQ